MGMVDRRRLGEMDDAALGGDEISDQGRSSRSRQLEDLPKPTALGGRRISWKNSGISGYQTSLAYRDKKRRKEAHHSI